MASELAFDRVLSALESRGVKYRKQPNGGVSARCPHHEGRGDTSLSVRGIEGCALVHCFGGCTTEDIVSSLGLTMADLFDDGRGQSYVYTDASGQPTRVVHRAPDKRFRQTGNTKRVDLYRLVRVVEAVSAGRPVYLVEGEKDVHTLESLDQVATTAPMGGGNFGKVDVGPLRGATVIAIADNDATGRKWAEAVNERLTGFASLTWKRVREGKDVTDHIMRGYGLGELLDDVAPGTKAWGEPLPLGWRPNKLPEFPVDCLPPVYRDYVSALSESTQTPLDIPGTVVLGCIAVAVGGRATVRPHGDWVEPVNLWVVPVAPPGSRKSAVISAATKPLREAEAQLSAELGEEVQEARIKHKILLARAEEAQRVAAKQGDNASMQTAVDAAMEAAREVPKPYPRLIVQDATPEVLISHMGDQDGRIAAISAEAGLFDCLSGRYAKERFLDHLLSSHAGDQILVDRRTREPERVDHPALTLISCMQPYAVKDMVSKEDYAGRGLLARVLWSIARDNVGFRDVEPKPVPETVREAYTNNLRELTVNLANRTDTSRLTLNRPAKALIVDFHRRLETQLRPTERLSSSLLRGWGGKGHGVAARLAGCLHIAQHGVGRATIDADTAQRAVRLAAYFTDHAITALEPNGDKATRNIRTGLETLINKVVTNHPEHTFTSRELQRALPRGLRDSAETVAGILDALNTGGWIRETKGGKYELHPRASEYLKRGDSGDSVGQSGETPGQRAMAQSPGLVTSGDTPTGESAVMGSPSPGVTATGDVHEAALSCEDTGADGAVTIVTAHDGSRDGATEVDMMAMSTVQLSPWSDDPNWAALLSEMPEGNDERDQDQGDHVEMMEWSG